VSRGTRDDVATRLSESSAGKFFIASTAFRALVASFLTTTNLAKLRSALESKVLALLSSSRNQTIRSSYDETIVGLDVSERNAVCVVTEMGHVILEGKVKSDASASTNLLRKHAPEFLNRRIVMNTREAASICDVLLFERKG
jgi:hypothetical protein